MLVPGNICAYGDRRDRVGAGSQLNAVDGLSPASPVSHYV